MKTLKEKCRRGHSMTGDNVGKNKAGYYCKTCGKENAARYKRGAGSRFNR